MLLLNWLVNPSLNITNKKLESTSLSCPFSLPSPFFFLAYFFIFVFIILLFYYFIILLFYYFIILLFYYFIILLFYYFIILLFYYFCFLIVMLLFKEVSIVLSVRQRPFLCTLDILKQMTIFIKDGKVLFILFFIFFFKTN